MRSLISTTTLPKIMKKLNKVNKGVFCSLSGPQVDKKQKQMEEPFRQCELSITVEINLKNLNFVDVLFDLTIETFKRT